MTDRVIENPIINSPYLPPSKHFEFDSHGVPGDIKEGRRPSSFFIPVPKAQKGNAQVALDLPELGLTGDQIEQNHFVNAIRRKVDGWRIRGYPDVTPTSRRLLEYWSDPSRDNKILFCQREAAETAIYLAEAAHKQGDPSIHNTLAEINATYNNGLPRVALKMATGSGKTIVMAMLIAWQTLNKVASPQDKRFAKRFLVVAPGLTIRDRLRVLLPEDDGNYYRMRDLVPVDLYGSLAQAKIVITNYHAFQRRETKLGQGVAKTTKELLAGKSGAPSPFLETVGQMVARVCRELGDSKSEIVVLNDEAHHCYRDRIDDPEEGADTSLSGESKKEAEGRNDEARVWFRGLQAVKAKLGIKAVYDLSATPFFLAGSGYKEGTLFPWVASDFSLVEAIESGIVKIPRVPVDDNSTSVDVTYLQLWQNIRDQLPKKGRKDQSVSPEHLPPALEGALHSLYDSYKKSFEAWQDSEAAKQGDPPPVFIVVCNNTTVSKMVYDWIGGWDKPVGEETTVAVRGKLPLFSNVDDNGQWLHRPPTILVDSEQFEKGELTPEFRKTLGREIEEFKQEYAQRFPGRSADDVDDVQILREVMNTVGKTGKLGGHVRCVVSVSMLTEGWDANTVTHILGVRAFSTQLLCEQVVGRGLRRRSYAVDENGFFTPEYADVYGVPFQFMPTSGKVVDPKLRVTRHVRAIPGREHAEISFPRLVGYRIELPDEELVADFDEDSRIRITTDMIPTQTTVAGVVGDVGMDVLQGLQEAREQEVAFELARRVMESYLTDPNDRKPWLFPQILRITKRWLAECIDYDPHTFVGLLLIAQHGDRAARRIKDSILTTKGDRQPRALPIFRPFDHVGSTAEVNFSTTKQVFPTAEEKSHVNYVVLDGVDGNTWEQKVAQILESMEQVAAYVKNDHLGFSIPYSISGQTRQYVPDFLVRLKPIPGDDLVRTLIVEVSGSHKPADSTHEKAVTTRDRWVPAVNNHGGFGQWSYCELKDPEKFRTGLEQAIQALYGGFGTSAQVGPTWDLDPTTTMILAGEGK
ncbi:Type III restriction-modification enzyme, helicase subunit [[Actinomadura] parvosata subsp. kistnae]|uniref:Restriction endonuclease subunit R n=1 Tax=[Actinomadura] parvosata subsp. kistnae TaxID=1909395 RepID=A0A1V0AEC5_9ACTN|nr:DEAD/DEAH box helicase family protein [Nonomuraea sp. ATCC 55076]AQZ68580.1 restriction endonuclease subunit R [Nonomuraea sp. ATCC 55076]SPL92951.1 Type III restriction-modification enzyme, helicase subunit [Actinomadura parvosata subsp. kistnae]